MGRMKELYIEICEANGGIFPGEISLTQAIEMRELNLLNLEEYYNHLNSKKLKENIDKVRNALSDEENEYSDD